MRENELNLGHGIVGGFDHSPSQTTWKMVAIDPGLTNGRIRRTLAMLLLISFLHCSFVVTFVHAGGLATVCSVHCTVDLAQNHW